jgi:peptide-methionine (S)-S-oxide reductase
MTRMQLLGIAGLGATIIAGMAALTASNPATAAAEGVRVPAPAFSPKTAGSREVAVLAGGCFWGVEAVYERVKGVSSVVSGYAGPGSDKVDYASVTSGRTGKAEAVRIIFDPSQVSYAQLLQVYFSVVADPTEVNRQGPDVGTHYRTAFFPQSPAQDRVARAYIAQLTRAGTFKRPIATRIERGRFTPAEAYHQDFMRKNPAHPYIVVHDRPKVAALRRNFPALWRA